MKDKKVVQALQLLRAIEKKKISVKEAIEVIETVTIVPEKIREILEIAQEKGLIKRKKGELIFEHAMEFRHKTKKIECEDRCKRCGKKITLCYFILLPGTEIGPLGSECIKKVRSIMQG
jgi:selenophosphate synthetase-related protein